MSDPHSPDKLSISTKNQITQKIIQDFPEPDYTKYSLALFLPKNYFNIRNIW